MPDQPTTPLEQAAQNLEQAREAFSTANLTGRLTQELQDTRERALYLYNEAQEAATGEHIQTLRKLIGLPPCSLEELATHSTQILANLRTDFYEDTCRSYLGEGPWVQKLNLPDLVRYVRDLNEACGVERTRELMTTFGGSSLPGPIHRLFFLKVHATKFFRLHRVASPECVDLDTCTCDNGRSFYPAKA